MIIGKEVNELKIFLFFQDKKDNIYKLFLLLKINKNGGKMEEDFEDEEEEIFDDTIDGLDLDD